MRPDNFDDDHGGGRRIQFQYTAAGKGIATQAFTAFLEIVTTRPLYGHMVKHNLASIRVLEKCGFAFPGEEGEEVVLILRD